MIKVLKFGGTSVGSVERIKNVANIVASAAGQGHKIIVVVSAMAGVTDSLIAQAEQLNANKGIMARIAMDSLLASGEQIGSSLLCLAIQSLGLASSVWQGWQIPIITNSIHGKARIKKIITDKIYPRVMNGEIAIVSGFQGVDNNGHITTLGRGGSDTTAVAIAAAVKASSCEIYTDVDGVYSADPRIVNNAKYLAYITFEEMLELAALGSKVLHHRSVEIASKEQIDIYVKSTFNPEHPGTLITNQQKVRAIKNMETRKVTGISLDTKEVQLKILAQNSVDLIFLIDQLAKIETKPDMLSIIGNNSCIFTLPVGDLPFVHELLDPSKFDINIDHNIAKISIIGMGIRSNFDIVSSVYKTLSEKLIEIYNLSCSEIKISITINKDYAELAVRSLHSLLIED